MKCSCSILIKTQICFIECAAGYYDGNCSKVCPYPSFGKRCQSICKCTEGFCHHARGCVRKMGKGNYDLC